MSNKNYMPIPLSMINADDRMCCEGRHAINVARKSDADSRSEAHIHSFFEIYVNVTGDVSFMVENNIYPITAGDIIITRPNEVHHCIYNSSCEHEHYCVWIAPEGDTLNNMMSAFFDRSAGERNLISMSAKDKKTLLEYLAVFCIEKDEDMKVSAEEFSAFFGILALIEKYKGNTGEAKKLPKQMEDILKYIELNFSEACKVEEVAEAFFISRSALGNMFKKYIGLSPSAYIDAKRFSYAKSLLEKGVSVQDVCDACGFSDCSYFISAFKRRFKITPYQYAKKYKK